MKPCNNSYESPKKNILPNINNNNRFSLLSYNPKKQKYFSKKKYFKQLIKSHNTSNDNPILDYSLLATRKKRSLETKQNNTIKKSLTKIKKIDHSEKIHITFYINLYDQNNNEHKFSLYMDKNIGLSDFSKNENDGLKDDEKGRKSITEFSPDELGKTIKMVSTNGLKMLTNYKYISNENGKI